MPISYEDVVPWGRSKAEYIRMFSLTREDLGKSILDCGGGPASFNAEMTAAGGNVISADPVYALSAAQLTRRIEETFELVLTQTRENMENFTWGDIPDLETLAIVRRTAMESFLQDFEKGYQERRYQPCELPVLPMEDLHFDLALSSHFLFLYTENLTTKFHIEAVLEMLRTAREVRVFPLVDMNAHGSIHLDPVAHAVQTAGFDVEIRKVNYEFQKGGNRMMVARHRGFTEGLAPV